MALSPPLLQELTQQLTTCWPFANFADLQTLFTNKEIAHWRDSLREMDTRTAQIAETVSFLHEHHDTQGQNGLVLFLQALLLTRIPPKDSCHAALDTLRQRVANELSPQPSHGTPTTPLAPPRLIENPFYISGRINDPRLFTGRERLLREIRSELKKGSSISLVGGSQMGKSSLLHHLYLTRAQWLPDRPIHYIDLQGMLDEADFCETVLRRLGEKGETLRDLKRALSGREVILLFDEMERLAQSDFTPRLHDLLRSLAQEPHFAFCLATQHPLIELFPPRLGKAPSDFYNIFALKELAAFSEAEARQLLARYLTGTGITFRVEEVEGLLRESQCHPARLQRLAHTLFDQYIAG